MMYWSSPVSPFQVMKLVASLSKPSCSVQGPDQVQVVELFLAKLSNLDERDLIGVYLTRVSMRYILSSHELKILASNVAQLSLDGADHEGVTEVLEVLEDSDSIFEELR
jgi:hypothetical protein